MALIVVAWDISLNAARNLPYMGGRREEHMPYGSVWTCGHIIFL